MAVPARPCLIAAYSHAARHAPGTQGPSPWPAAGPQKQSRHYGTAEATGGGGGGGGDGECAVSGFITTWILKGRLPFSNRLIEGTHKSTTLKTKTSVFVKMLFIFVLTVSIFELRVLFTESIFVFTMSIFVPSVSFTPTNRLSTRAAVRKMLVAQVKKHVDTERIILVSTPPGTTVQMAAKSFASESPIAFPGPSSGPKALMLALGGVGGAGGGGSVDDAPLSCGYTRSCRTRAAGMGPRAVARGGIRRDPIESKRHATADIGTNAHQRLRSWHACHAQLGTVTFVEEY